MVKYSRSIGSKAGLILPLAGRVLSGYTNTNLHNMKKKIYAFLILLSTTLYTAAWAQSAGSGSGFEGILTVGISMAGVDLSQLAEVDYQGDVQQQAKEIFEKLPPQDMQKLQSTMEANPMLGMVFMMTPSKGTIYLKNGVAVVKSSGLGFKIEHYHNQQADEALLYTASLIEPGQAVTAAYKPSADQDKLFTEDKRITPEAFNITRTDETVTVAGYTCAKAIYTPKSDEPLAQSAPGMSALQLRKLVLYTSNDVPKDINFSHPYYLPEGDGIMRIDLFFDDSDVPTMVYEIKSVEKTTVADSLLQIQKTEPLYSLSDMDYGMQVLGIMMGGMGAFQVDED